MIFKSADYECPYINDVHCGKGSLMSSESGTSSYIISVLTYPVEDMKTKYYEQKLVDIMLEDRIGMVEFLNLV